MARIKNLYQLAREEEVNELKDNTITEEDVTVITEQVPNEDKLAREYEELGEQLENGVEVITDVNNSNVAEISAESLAYCCGKLGIEYKTYNKLKLSREDLPAFFKKIKETIMAIITKIRNWFGKMWRKVRVWLFNMFKYFNKIADEFRFVRNRGKLQLSESTCDAWNNLPIPFKTLDSITEYLKTIPKLVSSIKTIYKSDFINGVPKDNTPFTLDFALSKRGIHILSNTDNTAENFTPYLQHHVHSYEALAGIATKKTIKYQMGIIDYVTYESHDLVEPKKDYDFDTFFNIAKAVDELRFSIKNIDKEIDMFLKEAEKDIKELEKKDSLTDDEKNNLKSLSACVTYLPNNLVFSIIDIVKILTRCLKRTVADAETSTAVGYYAFVEKCKTDPDYFKAFETDMLAATPHGGNADKFNLGGAEALNVVDDGKYLYIDVGDIDGKCSITYCGGAMASIPFKVGVDKESDSYKNATPEEKAQADVDPETFKSNIRKELDTGRVIFISRSFIENNTIKDLLKGFTFDLIYYHEVGHVVTGQDEITYLIDSGNPMDSFTNELVKYTQHTTELRADAYAALVTGTKPQVIIESRVAYLLNLAKEQTSMTDEDIEQIVANSKAAYQSVGYDITDDQVEELRQHHKDKRDKAAEYMAKVQETYSKRLIEEMKNIRPLAKLGLRGFMRSLLYKGKK